MDNYYYSGEFGYFNVILLPALEKYKGNKIIIHTFPDYCYIIKNLFGDKFECNEIKLSKLRILSNNLEDEEYKKLYKPVNILFKSYNIWEMNTFEKISKTINSPFSVKNDDKNYICYFPRYRDSGKIVTNFAERNSNEEECKFILNLFTKNNIKIYILGKEILDFDYDNFNIEKVEDIEQSIYYLKNCKFLISNDSGYIDFAKNCGCKEILILRPIEDYHNKFNPFNCKQFTIDDVQQLETFI
jgi:ADP-heptose:LPS heptosyltransferase